MVLLEEEINLFNNIQGDDDCLIVIRNLNSIIDGTYARVKSQFVRKGQILTVEGLPNGTYFFERMIGSYWLDNIKSNKTIREGAFYSDERFLRYRKDYFKCLLTKIKKKYSSCYDFYPAG